MEGVGCVFCGAGVAVLVGVVGLRDGTICVYDYAHLARRLGFHLCVG
jgi:hypothetical protein